MTGFGTTAVQVGTAQPRQQPTSFPLYQTAAWRFDTTEEYAAVALGNAPGYLYTRGFGNPTVDAFEDAMARLDGTPAATAFSSGMAALNAVLECELRPGAVVVADTSLYGGTRSLLQRFEERGRCSVVSVDVNEPITLGEVLVGASLLVCEVVANWDGKVVDLPAVLGSCRAAGVTSVVDSSFATPYLCTPARLGADYVVHSASKYIGGHGDLVAGVVCTDASRADALRHEIAITGAAASPLDAWLALRGLATLGLRMERVSDTAQSVAAYLASHPAVDSVRYPGLPGDRWHDVAERVLRRPGGLITFDHAGGAAGAAALCSRVQVAWLAGSLGGAQTVVAHPASTISGHRTVRAVTLPGATVKVSIGLEDAVDLVADFEQALNVVPALGDHEGGTPDAAASRG